MRRDIWIIYDSYINIWIIHDMIYESYMNHIWYDTNHIWIIHDIWYMNHIWIIYESYITTNASGYMNQILQPYMKQVCSYCKSATHVVNILKYIRVPPTSYLAGLDIESLYTTIRFDMAIEVFLKIFSNHPRLVIFVDLLKYVLKIIFFSVAGKFTIRSVASPWVQRWRPL